MSGGGASGGDPSIATDETLRRRRALHGRLAALALVLLVVAVWWLISTSASPEATPTEPSAAPDVTTSPTAESSSDDGSVTSEDPASRPSAGADEGGAPGPGGSGDPADPAAPSPGGAVALVPEGRDVADPVPLEQEARPLPAVDARIADVEAVEGEAQFPGEVGGPSLLVTVEVRNGTAADLDLSLTVLNLFHGAAQTPALPLTNADGRSLPATLAPGEQARGSWLFLVPADDRDEVTIVLDLAPDAVVVLFQGAAPPA